tara:strand:+ start:657 stop:947 length:291 start_codon:yes stop_codon:yes gene_type:complete
VGLLQAALEKEDLSSSGSHKVLVARLYNHKKKAMSKYLEKVQTAIRDLEDEMEETIGHPVNWGVVFQELTRSVPTRKSWTSKVQQPSPHILQAILN